MALRRIKKEYDMLLMEPADSAEATLVNDDDYFSWKIKMIAPPPYDGMELFLNINFTREYPFKPPKITFDQPVPYHPFLSQSTPGGWCNCCIWRCFLKLEWSPSLTVPKLLPLIRNFLEFPPQDDGLNPQNSLGIELMKGYEQLHAAVRAYYREKQNASHHENNNAT